MPEKISRREFLKIAGIVGAGAALAACEPSEFEIQYPQFDCRAKITDILGAGDVSELKVEFPKFVDSLGKKMGPFLAHPTPANFVVLDKEDTRLSGAMGDQWTYMRKNGLEKGMWQPVIGKTLYIERSFFAKGQVNDGLAMWIATGCRIAGKDTLFENEDFLSAYDIRRGTEIAKDGFMVNFSHSAKTFSGLHIASAVTVADWLSRRVDFDSSDLPASTPNPLANFLELVLRQAKTPLCPRQFTDLYRSANITGLMEKISGNQDQSKNSQLFGDLDALCRYIIMGVATPGEAFRALPKYD